MTDSVRELEQQRNLPQHSPTDRASERALVERVHREAVEQYGQLLTPPQVEALTIPCAELPEAKPDSPLYCEWTFYRGAVERLLADGHEGRWVLVKGEQIVGIWDTRSQAKTVALQKYLMQPCLIHQIRSREPLVRMSARFRECQR